MPHASDLVPTPHDRHDTLLVAALAGRDLAGLDEDRASRLIRSCSDCAALHDDLVAIARATAVVPPPIAHATRDFRLTPADAARLRPPVWRRLGSLRVPRPGALRPLGAGLTTLGLVGLLIGNVQVTPMSAPTAASAGTDAGVAADGAYRASASEQVMLNAPSAAPALGGAPGTEVQPAASEPAGPVAAASAGASMPSAVDHEAASIPAAGGVAAAGPEDTAPPDARDSASTQDLVDSTSVDSSRPLNLLFIAAIVLGLGLLLAGRARGRRPG